MQSPKARHQLLKQGPLGKKVAEDALVDGDLLVYDTTTGEWLTTQALDGNYTMSGTLGVTGLTSLGAATLSGLLTVNNDINLGAGQEVSLDETNATMKGQYEVIADDATATFTLPGVYCMTFIVSSWNTTAYAQLFSDTTAVVSISKGVRMNVDLTIAGTNPDVDGDVNIWYPTSSTVSIKNRLGSSRNFSIFSMALN